MKHLVLRVCREPLLATQTKILEGIRQLLDVPLQRSDINKMCSENRTACGPLLHYAAASGCLELVQLLVKKGVDPSMSLMIGGSKPADWAHKRRLGWGDVIGQVEIFDNYDRVIGYLNSVSIDGPETQT